MAIYSSYYFKWASLSQVNYWNNWTPKPAFSIKQKSQTSQFVCYVLNLCLFWNMLYIEALLWNTVFLHSILLVQWMQDEDTMSWVLSKQPCHQLTCQTLSYLELTYAAWFWQWSCILFLLCDRFESKHCIGECSKAYSILLFGEPTISLTFNSCASNLIKHFL